MTPLMTTGVAAVGGGVGLSRDPGGNTIGWATDLLAPSPSVIFMIPGIILFAANGLLRIIIGTFNYIPGTRVGGWIII